MQEQEERGGRGAEEEEEGACLMSAPFPLTQESRT